VKSVFGKKKRYIQTGADVVATPGRRLLVAYRYTVLISQRGKGY